MPLSEGASMPRPRVPAEPVLMRAARLVDVDKGEYIEPGNVLVEGEHIAGVNPSKVPDDTVIIDLGDLTLLPGLMDMEVNLLMGGPDHGVFVAVQDDPAVKTLRGVANARRTR